MRGGRREGEGGRGRGREGGREGKGEGEREGGEGGREGGVCVYNMYAYSTYVCIATLTVNLIRPIPIT